MVMINKKDAQERVEAFTAKLKANGKTWKQFLKEQEAELDKRFSATNKVANEHRKKK